VYFAEFFIIILKRDVITTSKLLLFRISGIFGSYFGCFYTCRYSEKKHVDIVKFF